LSKRCCIYFYVRFATTYDDDFDDFDTTIISEYANHAQTRPITPSHTQSHPVTPSHAWWQCDRISICASTAELIRRELLNGGGLLPGWVNSPFALSGGLRPIEPPPVFVIVSDIRDSEIQDRARVLYSYSYLRGSYEIEADLTQ
jgi:hypothetical protein